MSEFFTLNRNLQLRIVMVFLSVLLGSTVGPNMTIYYVRYFGAFWTGLLLLVVSVAGFLAGLYGGHMADIWGRKRTMMVGSAGIVGGYALAMLMNSPLFVNPYVTFFGFLLTTVGYGFADPAEEAMLIDVSTPQNRQFIYALIYWIINVGVMIGAALGGWFFRDYLFELLLALVIGALVNLSIIIFLVSETFPKEKRPTHSPSVWSAVKSYRNVLRDRRYVVFSLGMIGATIIFSQADYYLPAHLAESFHSTTLFGVSIYGQRMLSVMTLTNTVMVILLMGVIGKITRELPLRRTLAVGLLMQGGGFALAFLLNDWAPLLAAAVILTMGEIIGVPANQTLRADLMNPKQIGTYSGFSAAMRPIGMIIASLLVSLSPFLKNYGVALVLVLLTIGTVYLLLRAEAMPAYEEEV